MKNKLMNFSANLLGELKTEHKDFKDIVIKCLILYVFAFLSLIHYVFVFAVVALAVIFILFEKTSRCTYYMIFLLPFLNILRKTSTDLYYSIALWCLVLLVLGIKLFISFFIKKDREINWLFTILTAMLLVYITVIGPFSFTTHGAAYLTIAICYVLYYYMKDFSFKEIVFIFFLGAILASMLGFVRPLFARAQSIIPYFSDYGGRFTGVSNDPNYYAGDLLMILAGMMILYDRGEIKNLFYIAMFGLTVFAIMSLSKMMLVIYGLLMTTFCLIIFFKHKWKAGFFKCLSFLVCFLLSCLVCFNSILNLTGRITRDSSDVKQEQTLYIPVEVPSAPAGEGSETGGEDVEVEIKFEASVYVYRNNRLTVLTTGRTNIWLAYFEESFSSAKVALLGHGIGAPFILCDNGYKIANFAEHNTFVQAIYRLGIIGILLVAAMIYAAVRKTRLRGINLVNLMVGVVMFGLFMALCNLLSYRLSIYLLILFMSLTFRGQKGAIRDEEKVGDEFTFSKEKTDKMLSIIIPCFNVEEYIEKCVKSITDNASDKANYEIILVDDGSTDDTMKKLKEIAKENKNVVVTQSIGKGVSAARNTGLGIASGEYVAFIDGDDYVNEKFKDAIDLICGKENFDVVQFGFVHEKDGEVKALNNYPEEMCDKLYTNDNKEINKVLKLSSNSACYRFVKRDLIVQNNILFKRYTVAEDMEWSTRVLLNSGKIYLSNIAFYHYVRRSNSAMGAVKLSKTTDALDACSEAMFVINNSNVPNSQKRALRKFISNTAYSTLQYYKKLTKEDKVKLKEKLEEVRDIFTIPSKSKFLLIRACILLVGFDGALFALGKLS